MILDSNIDNGSKSDSDSELLTVLLKLVVLVAATVNLTIIVSLNRTVVSKVLILLNYMTKYP